MSASMPPEPSAPPPEGRPAAQELAELLLLRRRPALLAIGGVLLLAVLVSLVLPSVLPASAATGLVVGVVALLVALVGMVLTDQADPVVRGPRHVRLTGHTVVGRVGPEAAPARMQPVVQGYVQALEAVRFLRVLVVGIDVDATGVAHGLAHGVAGADRSALLVDLTDTEQRPGVSDVRVGTHRLAEAATVDQQRQFARTGVGTVPEEAIAATITVADTPPSDLDLLVTVLPTDARPDPELLGRTERVLAVVPLGMLERDELARRLEELEGDRSNPVSVVVVDVPAQPTPEDRSGASATDTPDPDRAAEHDDEDPGATTDGRASEHDDVVVVDGPAAGSDGPAEGSDGPSAAVPAATAGRMRVARGRDTGAHQRRAGSGDAAR